MSRTYDIIDVLLLEYETGKRVNDHVIIREVVGIQEEGAVIFGALKCEYNGYYYLIHFKIGNSWIYPSNDDIKEIENELFSIINNEVKKY